MAVLDLQGCNMTIEEVKKKYGGHSVPYNRDDYVFCDCCPLEHTDCGCTTGFEDCWVAIAKYMTAIETANKKENPYWERVCELANHQRSKGIGKYGKGLEDNPAAMVARITHLQEELIDGLMYCEWIKDKLHELEGEKHD